MREHTKGRTTPEKVKGGVRVRSIALQNYTVSCSEYPVVDSTKPAKRSTDTNARQDTQSSQLTLASSTSATLAAIKEVITGLETQAPLFDAFPELAQHVRPFSLFSMILSTSLTLISCRVATERGRCLLARIRSCQGVSGKRKSTLHSGFQNHSHSMYTHGRERKRSKKHRLASWHPPSIGRSALRRLMENYPPQTRLPQVSGWSHWEPIYDPYMYSHQVTAPRA